MQVNDFDSYVGGRKDVDGDLDVLGRRGCSLSASYTAGTGSASSILSPKPNELKDLPTAGRGAFELQGAGISLVM